MQGVGLDDIEFKYIFINELFLIDIILKYVDIGNIKLKEISNNYKLHLV
jgi:hypothetical protein